MFQDAYKKACKCLCFPAQSCKPVWRAHILAEKQTGSSYPLNVTFTYIVAWSSLWTRRCSSKANAFRSLKERCGLAACQQVRHMNSCAHREKMGLKSSLTGPQQLLMIKKDRKGWQGLFMFIKPDLAVLTQELLDLTNPGRCLPSVGRK